MELPERWRRWLTFLSGVMIVIQGVLGVLLLVNGDTEAAVVLFSTIMLWVSSILLLNIEKLRD